MVMPLEPKRSPFEKQLEEWEKQAKSSQDKAEQTRTLIETRQSQLPKQPVISSFPEPDESFVTKLLRLGTTLNNPVINPVNSAIRRKQVESVKVGLTTLITDLERNEYFAILFSQVPILLMAETATSANDVLTLLQMPESLTPENIATATDIIDEMVTTITELPEMAVDAPSTELPPLVAPRPVPPATGIQLISQMTTEELVKQFTAPRVPDSAFTTEQWVDYLKSSGQVDDTGKVLDLKAQATELVKQWQDRKSMLEGFRRGVAEMPEFKLVDLMKEAIIQPGLAMMDVGAQYFHYVSAPLAGNLYRHFFPDVRYGYEKYRQTESTWMALGHAWEDMETHGTGEWFTKYMVLEALVDPLSYVGWGIATRLTRPLGGFGRWVAAGERATMQVIDRPFDLIKSGIKLIPKTPGLRALSKEGRAGQLFQNTMELNTKKLFRNVTERDAARTISKAIRYTFKHPHSDELLANMGRELLAHRPLTLDQVKAWNKALKSPLTDEQITSQTIGHVNDLFEDMFWKQSRITEQEAGAKLLKIFSSEESKETLAISTKLLKNHRRKIITEAESFGVFKSPYQSLRSLMKRNFKISIDSEASVAARTLMDASRYAVLKHGVSTRIQTLWTQNIEKMIIRPFAEAYLTFGMYGPMNVAEDYWRSIMGGVRPGRSGLEDFQMAAWGLRFDPNLNKDAVSETLGFLRARPEGEVNNWILQFGGLAKGFGDTVWKKLVIKPGQISSDIRRHFILGRYKQILQERGGEALNLIMSAGPRELLGVDKNITKQFMRAMEDAKMSGNPQFVRSLQDDFTRKKVIRKEIEGIFKEHPDLPMEVRQLGMRLYDEGALNSPKQFESFTKDADNVMMDKFIRSPDIAAEQIEMITKELIDLGVENPVEMAQSIQALYKTQETYGALPNQVLGRATERSFGLPFAERNTAINQSLDEIASFREKAGASLDRLIAKLRSDTTKVGLDDSYVTAGNRLFDIMTTKRARASELGLDIDTWRRTFFAEASPADLKDQEFWNLFKQQSSARWKKFNVEMAEMDSLIAGAIDNLNVAGGVAIPPRQPIRIKGPLSPNDVAKMLGVRGDDISRGLLDVITAQNDKDYFVAYIMGKVQPGDIGFTKASVGEVYDQIVYGLGVRPDAMNWMTSKRLELNAVRTELHDLHNSKLFPDNEVEAIRGFVNDTADAMEELMFIRKPGIAKEDIRDIGMAEVRFTEEEMIEKAKRIGLIPDDVVDPHIGPIRASLGLERTTESGLFIDTDQFERIRETVTKLGHGAKISSELVDEVFTPHATTFTGPGAVKPKNIEDAVNNWFHFPFGSEGNAHLQLLGKAARANKAYLRGIHKELRRQNPSGFIRLFRGSGASKTKNLDPLNREFTNATSSRATAKTFEDTWDVAVHLEDFVPTTTEQVEIDKLAKVFDAQGFESGISQAKAKIEVLDKRIAGEQVPSVNDVIVKIEDIVAMAATRESELIIPTKILKQRMEHPLKPPSGPPLLREEFKNYQGLRQDSMDEAHKWYFKEYTDYTHGNQFDAAMKAIYSFWTYESQRWFWTPRSFIRKPGTFTELSRYQNNSDNGYVHIPGTQIDINPFRGSVYGAFTTRMVRRDYPEYYDQMPFAGNFVEFMDFLSRYGFYPGAHIGIPLALLGGREAQLGEVFPAIIKTPLDAMVAMFPENENVKAISNTIFNDRFRDYVTIKEVDKRGGSGTLIFAKMKENQTLTEEEQQMWDTARGEVSWYLAGFEQFGLFRLRSEEQNEMFLRAGLAIEEMTGYTPDQQEWLRRHGFKLWDMVGGISDMEQKILEELDYYRWVGAVRPLLPGREQVVLNQIDIAWDEVDQFTTEIASRKLELQRDFMSGARGPRDYGDMLIGLHLEQRQFIDNKTEEVPLMLLENRAEYYKEFDKPIPVQHPQRELLNLYFSIELKEITDPETGEKVRDWDTFWTEREAIELAVPDNFRGEWDAIIAKNSTRIEQVRRVVGKQYFRTYNQIWDEVLTVQFNEQEQKLIKEFLYLERTGQKLSRQEEIKNTVRENEKQLISDFRHEISESRRALRFANPTLDAWLFYWGRTGSFLTQEAEDIYPQLAKDTGRTI